MNDSIMNVQDFYNELSEDFHDHVSLEQMLDNGYAVDDYCYTFIKIDDQNIKILYIEEVSDYMF